MQKLKSQAGNTAVIVLVILLVLAIVAGAYYFFYLNDPTEESSSTDTATTSDSSSDSSTTSEVPVDPSNPVDEMIVNDSEDSDEVAEEINSLEVIYDGSSFSPRTLEISAGETVTFTNNSNRNMWVASDPHPIHTAFSAFDSKGNLDSYSFTFDSAGEYEYHNHSGSSHTGTIIVN
ncbi:MAG TPA: hypothetical protein ENI23_10315 [bacterium]|nr:hypothetical protein [bacterium]